MICYDHSHAKFFRICDLFPGGNAIVTGENRIDSGTCRPLDQLIAQTVAVRHTVWNIIIHLCSQSFQSFQ